MKIRVAEHIINLLVAKGIDQCFMVTGGAAMFLNDAIAHHPSINTTYLNHEQACAIAAEGYARVSGKPALVCVTSGPGGLNALTGVFGAWTDSVPMVVISGQVRLSTSKTYIPLEQSIEYIESNSWREIRELRQLGDQEIDITDMAHDIVKDIYSVTDTDNIAEYTNDLYVECVDGRPGPVWIDVPIDIQGQFIDVQELPKGTDEWTKKWLIDSPIQKLVPANIDDQFITVKKIYDKIVQSKRPCLLVGGGIRASQTTNFFRTLVGQLQIPVVTAFAPDVIPSDDPYYCGRQGTVGDRAGNFIVQNADLLLILGSRLSIRHVGYDPTKFAPNAHKIHVDVDRAELYKPTLNPDIATCKVDTEKHWKIHEDLNEFLPQFVVYMASSERNKVDNSAKEVNPEHVKWLAWCKERQAKYPVVQDKHRVTDKNRVACINPYHFIELLFNELRDDDVVVCGDGTASVVPLQMAQTKANQRLIVNSGCAAMGYDLPAAIGAALARRNEKNKRVICIAGDGSIQLNIQEIAVMVGLKLPIKLFILNNGGYASIRNTQNRFFGRVSGCDTHGEPTNDKSKLFFANPLLVAEQCDYDFVWRRSKNIYGGYTIVDLQTALRDDELYIANVYVDKDQGFEPRIESKQLPDGTLVSPSFENMFPFLSEEEIASNMITTT